MHYTNPLRLAQTGDYGFDIVYSNLTVLNAQEKDAGAYLCKVLTHDGKQNNVSTTVTVIGQYLWNAHLKYFVQEIAFLEEYIYRS